MQLLAVYVDIADAQQSAQNSEAVSMEDPFSSLTNFTKYNHLQLPADALYACLQSDADIADEQQSAQNSEPLSMEDLVSSLLEMDAATQMQSQPEDGRQSEEETRSVMATAMSNVVPDASTQAAKEQDVAQSEPWTAFDQLAVEQGDLDDNLNWGFLVRPCCILLSVCDICAG